MRARGLKQIFKLLMIVILKSRPMRARGLKHDMNLTFCFNDMSRPMRARGLKRFRCRPYPWRAMVAPHAGAWVETCSDISSSSCLECRAPCGRVG